MARRKGKSRAYLRALRKRYRLGEFARKRRSKASARRRGGSSRAKRKKRSGARLRRFKRAISGTVFDPSKRLSPSFSY